MTKMQKNTLLTLLAAIFTASAMAATRTIDRPKGVGQLPDDTASPLPEPTYK